jgi:hypothetical protein
MRKIRLVEVLLVVVLAVSGLILVWQSTESAKNRDSTSMLQPHVEVTAFETDHWYSGPVFPLVGCPFNVTIHNYESHRVEGLEILVRVFAENGSQITVQMYGADQIIPFDGILEANQTRTIPGAVMGELGATNGLTAKLIVRYENNTLDEVTKAL